MNLKEYKAHADRMSALRELHKTLGRKKLWKRTLNYLQNQNLKSDWRRNAN